MGYAVTSAIGSANKSRDTLKLTDMQRLFWLVFFVPVNILSQALLFALGSIQLPLDSAPYAIVLLKSVFFLIFCFGVFALKQVWRSVEDAPLRASRWSYRVAGLISIAFLFGVHAENSYQLGRTEREIHRNVHLINKTMPFALEAGMRIDRVSLGKREWIYETSPTDLQAHQIDRARFGGTAQSLLSAMVCNEDWEEWHLNLLEMGVRIRFVYRTLDGDVVASEEFEPGACYGATEQ